ncbi:MAG: hypothetical protein WCI72_02715 [archaeon]
MKKEHKIHFDVTLPHVSSAYVVGEKFSDALHKLRAEGYDLISGEQNAMLRVQRGKRFGVTNRGNLLSAGTLYIPGVGRYLTSESLVLDDPEGATKAHKSKEEYFVTAEQVERGLVGAVKVPDNFKRFLSSDELKSGEIGQVIFGDSVDSYVSKFVRRGMDFEIDELNYVNAQKQPYANILYWRGIDLDSTLYGKLWLLASDLRVRGIKFKEEVVFLPNTRGIFENWLAVERL